ncbi:MAG: 4-hydroxy-tetrahydrodipicolinate reductase [Deltaproteobacteria bacterium]|nr:4-hydroxy-tetrahydrodipicolinate reductase [Deltaproteobacteria bacterium]
MKFALVGYGKMGRQIAALALGRGHTVVSIDPVAVDSEFKEISATALNGVDACIDFSHPSQAVSNLTLAAELGCNVVMGTTAWYQNMDEVRKIVAKTQIGFIYATNFSIGVNLFYRIVEASAKLMDGFEEFDVAGFELHHRKKADSPSGTARTLSEILLANIQRKQTLLYGIADHPLEPQQLHFASARCGHIPGTHEVIFDSEADTISLKHTARNRQGFASGAITAAEWIVGKSGFFTINHLLEELISNKRK